MKIRHIYTTEYYSAVKEKKVCRPVHHLTLIRERPATDSVQRVRDLGVLGPEGSAKDQTRQNPSTKEGKWAQSATPSQETLQTMAAGRGKISGFLQLRDTG